LQLARHQGAVKNQFLAKLSHELRTPLHGILGLTRLLRDDAASAAPAARRLELVEASASHLLTLIDDLLDVSRIESGRLVLREEPVDLAALVREVGELHALRAHARGLGFETSVSLPSPCWVRADAARLRQVMHNLVGNAVKFTPRGGVGLRVERGATGGELRVTVRDSGQGIAPEDLAHVFEAFRQGRSADGQPAEGVGLGLTIAREIARALHGDITVTSERGVGSTFVFTASLPAADPPVAAPAPLPLQPGLKRALVAEDDDVNALIVGAFLAELGLEAERVVNGRAAVDAALRAQARPDVVLMDCTMPELDGWAATRAIRQAERDRGWSPVPIVALTATAGEADRRRCHDAGMDNVVTKPFTREQLVQALGALAPRPT
jgi:CheY-like chemotaxis protein/anti-sigma regulatory factor (Ser/Thr protein kinase)